MLFFCFGQGGFYFWDLLDHITPMIVSVFLFLSFTCFVLCLFVFVLYFDLSGSTFRGLSLIHIIVFQFFVFCYCLPSVLMHVLSYLFFCPSCVGFGCLFVFVLFVLYVSLVTPFTKPPHINSIVRLLFQISSPPSPSPFTSLSLSSWELSDGWYYNKYEDSL